MIWPTCVSVGAVTVAGGLPPAARTAETRTGTHALTIRAGAVFHTLDGSPAGAVNGETARAAGGNQLTGVVAVAGAGSADLDDVHVVAVDWARAVWPAAGTGRGPGGGV